MTNAINWFEIPVTNYERAKQFYSTVLGADVQDAEMPEGKYGVLPYDAAQNGIGGAIWQHDQAIPSDQGSTIYLNGGTDLNTPLSKVEAAGGKVIMPKTNIGEHGFMAQFIDTEGNSVAFHSLN